MIDRIVTTWADAVGLLVPRVVLRPIEAVDIVFDFVEQTLQMQRRMIDEVLGLARQYADDDADRSDGATVRSRRGALLV